MTAAAFELNQSESFDSGVQSQYIARRPNIARYNLIEKPEKDRLPLMLAIMAPASAAFWCGIGWIGYHCVALVIG